MIQIFKDPKSIEELTSIMEEEERKEKERKEKDEIVENKEEDKKSQENKEQELNKTATNEEDKENQKNKKQEMNIDSFNDIIITGSENGHCYLWTVYNKENDKIKNYNYEYFKIASSNNIINVAQIVSEKYYVNYFKKILSITNKIILDSIIIIGNDKGEIRILINIK